ncbi:molybdate ABC transporter substrate-binding protein [Parafrigoribacterium mesophilum]|uniref:molybdate ABC transporter substrate-binding protein n=1 Tax=Parafrigoribacterium mesophilum TaxID=433646 RepID=UPI0031FC264D
MTHRRYRLAAVFSAAVLLAGCSSPAPASSDPTPETFHTPALSGELTVVAAASLTGSFDKLAAEFGADNPGVTVKPVVYDGSSTLVTQLSEGAVADVFASADETNMRKASDAGLISGEPTTFASNTLQIAVAPGNPKGITGLADLAKSDLLVVLCAPQVPCGAASHKILNLDAVAVTPVSEEQNVKGVLTKVAAGEADAGLVYQTDVAASNGAVDGVAIAGAERAVNKYSIGIPRSAEDAKVGQAFITWVLSEAGQRILKAFGFGRP